MSKMDYGSKYIFKLIALIIVVIINIIAVIAVITSVGGALKDLKKDLSTGKIEINKDTQNQAQYNEVSEETEQNDYTNENELDFSTILKIVIANKNAKKSIILMTIALLLLAGAIFILIKLK